MLTILEIDANGGFAFLCFRMFTQAGGTIEKHAKRQTQVRFVSCCWWNPSFERNQIEFG